MRYVLALSKQQASCLGMAIDSSITHAEGVSDYHMIDGLEEVKRQFEKQYDRHPFPKNFVPCAGGLT